MIRNISRHYLQIKDRVNKMINACGNIKNAHEYKRDPFHLELKAKLQGKVHAAYIK